MQRVWDMLWDPKSSIFCDNPALNFDKTPKGYVPKIKRPGSSPPSGNWNYRGYFDPVVGAAGGYNIYDVVQYGGGTSAGGYLSTINGNSNVPDSGIGWVQVFTGTGVWL